MSYRFKQFALSGFILFSCAAVATIMTFHPWATHETAHVLSADIIKPVQTPSPSLAPTATPLPQTPPAPKPAGVALGAQTVAGISSLGIAAGSSLTALSGAELASELDQMRTIGVTWLRYDVEWSNIQHDGPSSYNWTDYDRVTTAAANRGFRIIGIIDYTPAWARLPQCSDSSMCAPADPQAYASFAATAARHFAGLGIHRWEIWNEPNSQNFFRPTSDPARYTQMLRLAYAQIKAVDPSSEIITGGLAPADTAGGSISPIDFLNGIYQQGAHGSFDAVGDHPYSFPFLVTQTNPDSAWGQMMSMRSSMVTHGDASKQIWVTEFGAPTGGPGSGPVNENVQSQMLSNVIEQIAALPWSGPFLWYSFKDAGTTSDTVENFFGLLRADGSPKPAFYTFRSLTVHY